MKESDLYPSVRDWLEKLGLEVHVEVFGVDVIGLCRRAGYIVAVEMKLCNSDTLHHQCERASSWADEVWAVIPTETKKIYPFHSRGFGLMRWVDGELNILIKAQRQPWHWHKRRPYRLKKLCGRAPAKPFEVAGLPSCPLLRCQRDAVDADHLAALIAALPPQRKGRKKQP